MEVFIFPELLYALVLANIMSPKIWKWRSDPWFAKIATMKPPHKIQRLKQYIMDHFSFNLDLDTWGLTTKEQELKRFTTFIDESILAQSNALFGYEGDKYYFDIDIRKHFGLDRYTTNVIPYWKTETVDAMEAFQFKEGYPHGAGECVSLAALYAAAAFVVIGIPLNDIYLLATPLHSQNFLDCGDGILTNNRRIVTKRMWFNGTELSAKARRALENERVTIVSHRTGYVHTLYPDATFDPNQFGHFKEALEDFLSTAITFEILANFLRQNSDLQRCFQIVHNCCGKPRYIEAEKVYHYEHSSKARVGEKNQSMLLHEIEEDEYYPEPLPNRLLMSELEVFFKNRSLPADDAATLELLKKQLSHNCCIDDLVLKGLITYCRTTPHLPTEGKTWTSTAPIDLDHVTSREEAIAQIEQLRMINSSADLAFAALRDLTRSPWKPFLKAAFERNPVSIAALSGYTPEKFYALLHQLSPYSIYEDGSRLAQPDEVWNFKRGDGLEQALCFMNVLRSHSPAVPCVLKQLSENTVGVDYASETFIFESSKQVPLPQPEDFLF